MKNKKIPPTRNLWNQKVSIATVLSLSLTIGVLATNPTNYLDSPQHLEVATLSEGTDHTIWDIHITNIQTKEYLETDESITLYEGDIQVVTHVNKPKEGYEYLLLSLYVNKMATDDSGFFSSDVKLYQNGTAIEQIDNSFLGNHNFSIFTKNEIRFGTNQGYLLFEVPVGTDLSTLKLETPYQTLELKVTEPTVESTTNISITENIMDVQWEIERQILEDYQQNSHTLENPYVVLDPYGWAPLSALVLFETDEPASVSVKIHGKDEYTHIEHHFDEMNTFHQIPIVGLYADYVNRVEIFVHLENGHEEIVGVEVTTNTLEEDSLYTDTLVKESNPEKMQNGLTFLQVGSTSKRPVAIDSNGDTRWILDHSAKVTIGRLENGNMLYGSSDKSILFELDLLGKMVGIFSDLQDVHHDAIQLPNGNLLTTSHGIDSYEDRILELDFRTGDVVNDIDLRDILSTARFNQNSNKDWFHLNSLWFDETDQSLIISGKHQGVAKITYPEGDLVWITTLESELEDLSNYYLTPTNPEKFKAATAQHAAMILPDQDSDPDTLDIILFDNNAKMLSMPDYPENRLYSRAVQYRIHEKLHTIEEIWSYGESRGEEYFGSQHGDANYLQNGNVLISFSYRNHIVTESDNTFNIGSIIEIDPILNEIVFEMDVKYNNKSGTYRVERLPAYPENWNFSLYESKGEVKARNHYETMQVDSTFQETDYLPSSTSSNRGSVSATFNDTFGDLDVSGFQIMEGVAASEYNMSLVFTSDVMTKTVPLDLIENSTRGTAANESFEDTVDYDKSSFSIAIPYEKLEAELPKAEYKIGVLLEANGKTQYKQSNLYFNTSSWSIVENKDVIASQNATTEELLADYKKKNYTLSSPFTVVNPYGNAPLSAISLFETDKPAQITVKVDGLNGGTSLENKYTTFQTSHQIPIYGLYSGKETKVHLTATYEDGTSEGKTFQLTGDALPEDFVVMTVDQADSSKMADGLTFYMRQSRDTYLNALDNNGDVRFMFSTKSIGMASGLTMLKNGNMLVVSEKTTGTQYYKNSFYEMDLTGKIYGEYLLEGVHHEITEANNGNFLALGNDRNGSVIEDVVYEIERNTGKILHAWDLDDILPLEAFDSDGHRVSSEVYDFNSHDWIHLNSVDQHPTSNEILLSARNHDVVVSMAYPSGEINYIIGDHDIPIPKSWKDKLLTPISEEFQWSYGQHNAQFLENGDILLFDNGSYRSKTLEHQVDSASEGYSRAVIYRVNQEDMTIEQVWEYGQELGSSHLATYLSGVQSLGENHFLINFGGQVFDEEGNPSYENADGVKGHSASIQYEVKNGEIIYASSFEIGGVSGNMYRAERHNPYFSEIQPDFSKTSFRYGALPNRNLLLETTLPENMTNSQNIHILSSTLFSDGVQLGLDFSLEEVGDEEQLHLYFQGDQKTYQLNLGTGTEKITKYLSLWEIPEGNYHLFLQVGEVLCDLNTYFQQVGQIEFAENLSFSEEAKVPSVGRLAGENAFLGEIFLYFIVIVGCSTLLLFKRNSDLP